MNQPGRIGLALAVAAAIAAAIWVGGRRRGRDNTGAPAGPTPADTWPTRAPAGFRRAPAPGEKAAPGARETAANAPASDADARALVDQVLQLLDRGQPLTAQDKHTLTELQDRLQQLGAAAAPALIARIDAAATRASARELLFHSLRQLPGPAATDRIVAAALAAPQPALRTMAIETLAQRRSAEAIQILAQVARNDPDLPPRPLIAPTRDPNDPSTELPDERKFTPRMQAMAALATTRDPQARDVLLDILAGGPDESLRMEAARNLRSWREDVRAAAGLQRAATSDPSAYVRLAALHALEGTADVAWLPVLGRIAAQDPDAGVRALAQQLLRGLGPTQ